MNGVLIVGATVAGAAIGAACGAWYGFATDKSDMPMMAVFTTPVGALVGGFAGCVAGVVAFA